MAWPPQQESGPERKTPAPTPPPPAAAARAVEERYARAARAAAAEAAEVARTSHARATALLRQPPARRLEALDGEELEPADRRRLCESVGVSLVPPHDPGPAPGRRGVADRLRLALARWRPNPFAAVIALLAAAPVVVGLGLAWMHTGRGASASGTCGPIVFTRSDGTSLTLPFARGEPVVVRGRDGPGMRIALWVPLSGYATASVYPNCLRSRP